MTTRHQYRQHGPRITLAGEINAVSLDDFIYVVNSALRSAYTDIVLDFADATRAWADAMIPIIAISDWLYGQSGHDRLAHR